MIYVNRNINATFRKFILSIFINLILFINSISIIQAYDLLDLRYLFILCYGNLNANTSNFTILIMFWSLHQIYLLYILRNHIEKDMHTAVYIMIRARSRTIWLMRKYCSLFIHVLIYYLFQIIVLALIGYFADFKIENFRYFIQDLTIMYIIQVLTAYFWIILNNVLTLKIKSIHAFSMTVIINTISLLQISIET